MRKCLIFILILALLPVSASAAESPKYLALVFDGYPREAGTLLAGLEARGVRVTFFLGEEAAMYGKQLLENRHELGILTTLGPELSRREIAGKLQAWERQADVRVRLLRPTAGCSDGLRQVAKALGLTFVIPTDDFGPLTPAADGEILLADGKMAPISLLEQVDDLQDQGFVFVTVSELARLRGAPLRPGTTCRCLPPKER